jgi:hypothetical protein
MPAADFNFIAEVIDVTGGRPGAPIVLRHRQGE